MAKIATLYRDWLRSLKLEKSELFELHRGEGGGKEPSKWKKRFKFNKET